MRDVLAVARKELAGFFTAPVAWLFLGAFLVATLFVFFWVETFFARNIADVRPLFEWLPLLLIFLIAALTMRAWSEERRMGTLESLLTSPVAPWQLVLGKFLAVMALVAIALLLTLPLPVTVAVLGPLDWGPVAGGYLAALCLAAAYTAIGLFVSSRNDSQIVSLIVTVALCGVFYLIGAEPVTALAGNRLGELLRLLGAGARFQSITRGVIDLRDLYYYLSITGTFLVLNVYGLERLRWSAAPGRRRRHRAWQAATALLVLNLLAGNLWLQQIGWARADVTAGRLYSLSPATRTVLKQLREPLLIRGYFSARTHPLLALLVPQLKDLLREYAVAGNGRVKVEFIDPLEDAQAQEEAARKYGIEPVPFQTASKYQAAVVNSYFDVVVQYGDQHEKLGFRDLIEVKLRSETDLDVTLRNPEYDITRAIKKVMQAYQAGGNLFRDLPRPVTFRGFISADERLPGPLRELRHQLDDVLAEFRRQAGDKLQVEITDPDSADPAERKRLEEEYGFRPMAASLLDPNTFWFYMVLQSGDQTVPVPLPETLDEAALRRAIQAALQRFGGGFLKTVALVTPRATPRLPQLGLPGGGVRFEQLEKALAANHKVVHTDLKRGFVPPEADLLLVVAPQQLDEKQRFAIDQFLMQGGTVILATSPFDITTSGAVRGRKVDSGLADWLKGQGITIRPELVLDPQNARFPIPIQRHLGGLVVQELQMVEYPYFVDIRPEGMARGHGITAGLPQVTLTWASPIELADDLQGRRATRLLHSSADSWTDGTLSLQPDFQRWPHWGFPPRQDRGARLLGVMLEGRFTSAFQGRPSPLLEKPAEDEGKKKGAEADPPDPVLASVIDHSPESARLIVFASNSFLSDEVLDLATMANGTRYLNPLQLVENAVDWSLEDRALLSIRSRAHYSRFLAPLSRREQMFWEYLNYGLALLGLALVYAVQRALRRRATRRWAALLEGRA